MPSVNLSSCSLSKLFGERDCKDVSKILRGRTLRITVSYHDRVFAISEGFSICHVIIYYFSTISFKKNLREHPANTSVMVARRVKHLYFISVC